MATSANPTIPAARRAIQRRANYFYDSFFPVVISWLVGIVWFVGGIILGVNLDGANPNPNNAWPLIIMFVAIVGCIPGGFVACYVSAMLAEIWCDRCINQYRRQGQIVDVPDELLVLWRVALEEVGVPHAHQLASLDATFQLWSSPLVRQYGEVLAHSQTPEADKTELRKRLSSYFGEAAHAIKIQWKVQQDEEDLMSTMVADAQHDVAQALLSQPLL